MPAPPTITAELRQWQLDDKNHRVSGKVYNDADGLIDGSDLSIGFKYITDYTEDLLVRSVANRYYVLRKDQAKDKDKWTK